MVNPKQLFKATKKKVISLFLVILFGSILLNIVKDLLAKILETFTLSGTIVVSLIGLMIGIYLNLKGEEKDKDIYPY